MVPHVPPTAQLLIPVPMHAKRLRERTFNQAALLAQHLAKLTGIPTNVHALTRLIPSDGQVHRTRAQRLKLSSRHFQANPQIVAGKHIVLIDDILTTGSTARACALALKRAGARTITVVTLCLTPEG